MSQFSNPTNLIAVATQPFAIICNVTNTSSNQNITWIRTLNKNTTTPYLVSNTNRTFTTTTNARILNFTNVLLVDEEYYACGYRPPNSTFQKIQAYYLYVKAFPTLVLTVDNLIINQTNTINLTVSDTTTYKIKCIASNAKPQVNLRIYDTARNLSLGDGVILLNNCNSTTQLCDKVYEVDFVLNNTSPFLNMNSITCESSSTDAQIDLSSFIRRNVSIQIPGNILSLMFFIY